MPENDDEITKLLRLKRFEKPSPEYFDNFLREFQDRQRAQLLREPAWRIAFDRFVAFFGAPKTAGFGYGVATAVVLAMAGLASFEILTAPPREIAVAQRPQQVVVAAAQPASFSLNGNIQQLPDVTELARRTAHSAAASSMQPRYVMDRPVSYEPPSSF